MERHKNHAKNKIEQICLKKELGKFFGFKTFRKSQIPIIKSLLAGKNTVAIMPTGGGKSLCYQFPAVIKEGTAIVVSPLIALMKNQVDFLKEKNIKAAFWNSTLTKKMVEEIKVFISTKELKLLYIAPETLNKEEVINFLSKEVISFIAIDEAHCISDWGHDFRPEYRKIQDSIKLLGNLPVIALTATATPRVEKAIIKSLDIGEVASFKYSFDRPNLYYKVSKKEDMGKELLRVVKKKPRKSGIIYCHSRKKVEEITGFLQHNNVRALAYHAGLDNNTRIKNQNDFLAKKVEVIVATIAFGMGIDKPDIRFVVHYDPPKSMENYYQETGRAGRDGKESTCVFFYDPKDIIKLHKFTNNKSVAERKNMQHLLAEVENFVRSSICRRKQVLYYFGEAYNKKCDFCDNCEQPTSTFKGKDLLKLLLESIDTIGEKFSEAYLVKVLVGIEDPYILSSEHHTLDIFGKGKDILSTVWQSIIRQTLLLGYISKDEDDLSTVKMTPLGHEFLKKPVSVTFYKDRDYILEEPKTATEDQAFFDKTLLKKLKVLREKEAKAKNLKPYILFQESMLEAIAQQLPTTIEGLTHLPGIGLSKAKKFGLPFVKLVSKYIKENNIDPIDAIIVKPSTAKFAKRIQLIQQIDRKIHLEQLATLRKISYKELIKELENICQAGIKLNLDYFIDETLDEDQQNELFDYFYEAETDNIERACSDLGEFFEEEEVRLMRIKFLSEVVN